MRLSDCERTIRKTGANLTIYGLTLFLITPYFIKEKIKNFGERVYNQF